jgi:hypothetical protein
MPDSNPEEPSGAGSAKIQGTGKAPSRLDQQRAEAIHQLALDTRAAREKAELAIKNHLSRRGRFGLNTSI